MMLLDTTLLEPEEGSELLRQGLDAVRGPALIEIAADACGRLHQWSDHPDLSLRRFTLDTRQFHFVRRPPPRLSESNPEIFSLSANVGGFLLTDSRGNRTAENRLLRVLDHTAEYGIDYVGRSDTAVLEVQYDRLGLRPDVARTAFADLQASPLHDLFYRHLRDLSVVADQLDETALVNSLAGTVSLARSLLLSVSQRDSDRRGALAQSLVARIEDYVGRHLSEADLTPARIAVAHHISVRHLYVLLADRAETPAEWIMLQRLVAARRDLASGDLAISAVAQRWGFADHSHFTRRFKFAYGVTPSEYQRSLR